MRENLSVWLQLQEEEATELVPRQVQSWLTGNKTQHHKAFGKNRRHHPSQTDLVDCSQTGTSYDDSNESGSFWGWDATTTTGRDKLGGILKPQKTVDDDSQTACTSFSIAFRLSDAIQDTQERSKTQKDGLELLEVAMWVDTTPSRKKIVVEGAIRVTVDMCALGMADVNQHLNRKTTTLMANDSAVAVVFRPCRCDHEQVTLAEGRRTALHIQGGPTH